MMPGSEKLDPSDAVLLRYLLGALPVDEAEPLEQASVVDDDLAARLNTMERDLVDSYVRGEIEGPNLAKFQSWYLSSPLRVQRVKAARIILRLADTVAAKATPIAKATLDVMPESSVVSTVAPVSEVSKPAPRNVPALSYGQTSAPGKSISWGFGKLTWPVLGFAAAVLILIVAVGFLTSKNKQLRREVAETKKQSSALTAQLDDQNTGAAGANTDNAGGPSSLAHGAENVATVTLFLSAPTRGTSTIPKLDVPAGTGLVVLSLGLGSTDEDNYRAQLVNPTTQKALWHSGLLRPGTDGTYVSVAVPANVLHSQVYLVQLMHDASNGKSELLATYPFRAEVK